MIEKMDARMEKGFDQIIALQSQVNSIEHQLGDTKMELCLGDLEEKVFGAPRRYAANDNSPLALAAPTATGSVRRQTPIEG